MVGLGSRKRRGGLFPYEQQAAAGVAAAGGDDAYFRRGRDLTVAGFAPHLRGAFVQEAVTMQPPSRQLAAVRVERKLPLACDPLSAFDERPALAGSAQAERLEPRH